MDGKNGPNTLSVNVFTAPGKAMVGERPKPFGERDAVLVDAMGTVAEAEALAGWVALAISTTSTV